MKKGKLIILVFSVAFSLLIIFFIAKQLTIKNIIIFGNKSLTIEEIKSLAGVKEGNSVILPLSKTIYERLKRSPWINEATVRKDLNGTLTIYIKEAKPLAVLETNGRYYLIDDQGNILEELKEISDEKLFLPYIKEIDPLKNKETLIEAINLIVFLNRNKIVKSNEKIRIEGKFSDDLTLHIRDFSIVVGKGDFERKFAKFRVVQEEIQKRQLKVKYIDLRFPDRVIVKPQEDGR